MLNETIPVHAMFAADNVGPNEENNSQETIEEADVIMGVDVMSGNEFLIFGRDLLQKIVSGNSAQEARVLRVSMDQETDELERFLAIVQAVKGQNDYESSPEV
jgi:hypothetical protein